MQGVKSTFCELFPQALLVHFGLGDTPAVFQVFQALVRLGTPVNDGIAQQQAKVHDVEVFHVHHANPGVFRHRFFRGCYGSVAPPIILGGIIRDAQFGSFFTSYTQSRYFSKSALTVI